MTPRFWLELRIWMTPLSGSPPGNPQLLGLCPHEACHGLSPSGLGAPQGGVGLAYCLASRVFDK